jgi:hypothetical protein
MAQATKEEKAMHLLRETRTRDLYAQARAHLRCARAMFTTYNLPHMGVRQLVFAIENRLFARQVRQAR